MANLVRRKQVDQAEFSGFFVEVGNTNYYPVLGNPSGFLSQSDLNTATGFINNSINQVSGTLNSQIISTGSTNKIYTDVASGTLDSRLLSSGQSLTSSISGLSGYVNTTSGNLYSTITGVSGVLNTKINTTSGVLKSYTDTVSGNLTNQITAASNQTVVSGIASGDQYSFTGQKIFRSPITAPRVNFSGSATPTSIAIVASSGSVSIVGSGGTFMSFLETGTTNSLWSVANNAGVPMLELFDDDMLVIGKSTRRTALVSGVSGYLILPNLPTQTQTGGLPQGVLFRSGNFLMII
jgi:hypothetical protein